MLIGDQKIWLSTKRLRGGLAYGITFDIDLIQQRSNVAEWIKR